MFKHALSLFILAIVLILPAQAVLAGPENDADAYPSEQPGTSFTHRTFTAVVPAGWTSNEYGDGVLFASPDQGSRAFVSVVTLPSDQAKDFADFVQVRTNELGGQNLEIDGTVANFTTDKGEDGMFNLFDNKCLLLIFSGDSPEIGNLIRSIDLLD